MKAPSKITELALILLYFVLVTPLILTLNLNYLITVFLYAGIPSIYLSIRKPQIIYKTSIFTITSIIPGVLILDYIAHFNNIWYVPTVLGQLVLDTFAIDEFIWGFFYVYFIVSLYEYMFDQDRNKRVFSHRTKIFYILFAIALTVFGIIYHVDKSLLLINYFYFVLILCFFIIPILLFLSRYPSLITKMVLMASYFFILSIICELVATYLGHWHFYGNQYIGFVELIGLKFPFEEFLWLILAVPAVLCLYEYFIDDSK